MRIHQEANKDSMIVDRRVGKGFTLIELLVVIAIVAILISIIMPSIAGARKHSMAVKCSTNLHHVGQAMGEYLADNLGVYPPAYIYPFDGEGNYDLENQPADHPYGYIHWSWFLYNKGEVLEDAFKCPSMLNGGAPRTNPGSRDWEDGQMDQFGGRSAGFLEDKQAPRIAYTGNAAIFPRNKFTLELSGGRRVNVLVNETRIHDPGRVVAVTEFNDNWKSLGIGSEGGILVKTHRPISPFTHMMTGSDEYGAPENAFGFTYGAGPYYGLKPLRELETSINLIDNPGLAETNAVGRHHPGGKDSYMGGAVNFLYADSHVEKKTVLDTIANREWGNRYYAISGNNKVGPPWD